MIQTNIDVQDLFSDRLEQFGRRAPTVALRICRTIAQDFRRFTRNNYMKGQVIGKRSGELWKSVKIHTDKKSRNAVTVIPWSPLANIYHNPDGATILPINGQALRWVDKQGVEHFAKRVHLEPRPWVPRAFAAFNWDESIQRSADKVIDREIAKLEAKRAAARG